MEKLVSEIISSTQIIETKIFGHNLDLENLKVKGIEFNSRKIKDDFLFFALPGIHTDGNKFILSAIENGANTIIYQGNISEELIDKLNHISKDKSFVLLKVEDARFEMAPVSALFFDNPSSKLITIGVTGTEGKSTTVSLVWQLLRLLGKKAGFISTVEYSLGGDAEANPEHQTTPEAPIVQNKLYQMVQNGCEYAVVESSSHGLSKITNRLGNVLFDGVAFMNVTLEHLEFHKTLEQYKSDKANLFRYAEKSDHNKTINGKSLSATAIGAVNLDDIACGYFAKQVSFDTWGFTMKGSKPCTEIKKYLSAVNLRNDADGVSFTLEEHNQDNVCEYEARINLPGTFNIYNTMAAMILVSGLTSSSVKDLIPLIPQLKPICGRMSAIKMGQDFEVIIDYAHTPSSFEVIFPPLKQRTKGKLICLFGSGGERDLTKRPIQGKIASEYADIVILANEDPRGEDPVELLEMIAKGCENLKRDEELFIIPDRKEAIRKAFSLASKDDIVLLLGKGHENSIIFKDRTEPYNEFTEAENALKELLNKK